MATNNDTTLNRSGAKGIDPARFRFKQAVDALGRSMYYAWLESRNLQGPAFEGAGHELRAHFWELAENVLLMVHPLLPNERPEQPVVKHCLPRNVILTLVPREASRVGTVVMKIEPGQRPS